MNKPTLNQNAFNFAAISFAIQYYRDEEKLVHAFKCDVQPGLNTPLPKAKVIRDWVSHFAVARSFTGFGKLSAMERDSAYEKIHDLICLHGIRADGESIVQRVSRFENCLRDELQVKTSLLSATTKLLWLIDRESIIYDGIVRKTLGTLDGDYESYCEKWESEFRMLSVGIENAVAVLAKSGHLFPETYDLKRDTRESWFPRRVFDTLHWQQI